MRKFMLLAGLTFVAAPATAQTMLGLRGGVGFATVSIEGVEVEEESVSRIVTGVDLGIRASRFFGLRLGGAYAQKGGAATVEGFRVSLNVDYLQLSALTRLATPDDGGLSVGVMVGPWAAYRLSCDVEAAAESFRLNAHCDNADFSDFDIKALDYGLAFGGGVELPLVGNLRLGLDALYSLGLAEVDEAEAKTRHLTLQAGLVFPVW
ncbi:outer membrane beta-barrel protein [Candidatus Palauibacter sp.]|uniref:outer membrane beta-barrel protein n=1 Tax=Candidatus Palauibacter sp. TaxID=3101350 RepID=UPI003B5AF479